MKHLILFLLVASIWPIHSQTSVIAHKSHSGQMTNFSLQDYDDNLGLPSPRLTEIIKLNDSTAVMVRVQPMMENHQMYDTVRSYPIEDYVESYLKYRNLDRINLVGFDALKAKILNKRKKENKGTFYSPIKPKFSIDILLLGLIISVITYSFFLYHKQKKGHSMKSLALILALLSVASTYGQTKIIAYKSHSGNMAYFSPLEEPDNLGNLPDLMENLHINLNTIPILDCLLIDDSRDTIIKYSDSLILYIPRDTFRPSETITDDPLFREPRFTSDSVQSRHPNIIFIGFDSTDNNVKQDSAKSQSDNNVNQNTTPPVQNKPDIDQNNNDIWLALSLFGLITILVSVNLYRIRAKQPF